MRRNEASDSEYPIRDERPRRCLRTNRSYGSREAPHRRTLRSKLSCGSEVNNGTGGQRRSFLLSNPVASIRLTELLVRSALSNPVRRNRGLTRGGRAKRWCKSSRKTIRDTNRDRKGDTNDTKGVLCRKWRVC